MVKRFLSLSARQIMEKPLKGKGAKSKALAKKKQVKVKITPMFEGNRKPKGGDSAYWHD